MIAIGARAHDYGKDKPDQLFHKIHKDGFSCIQLALKKAIAGVLQFSDVTPELVGEVKSALEKEQMDVAVLGVYIEPSLVDEKSRRKNVSELIGSIPIAKKLAAGCIGTETTNMNKQPQVSRKEALNALLDSLYKIMPEAEDYGVTIAIEPVYYHTVNSPECAAEVLKIIKSPNLKIIFDPVNLLTPGDVSSQHRLWKKCFESFGENIVAVHLKGVSQDLQGRLYSSDFLHSVVDYADFCRMLKNLPQKISVLREEINPLYAKKDFNFIRNLL